MTNVNDLKSDLLLQLQVSLETGEPIRKILKKLEGKHGGTYVENALPKEWYPENYPNIIWSVESISIETIRDYLRFARYVEKSSGLQILTINNRIESINGHSYLRNCNVSEWDNNFAQQFCINNFKITLLRKLIRPILDLQNFLKQYIEFKPGSKVDQIDEFLKGCEDQKSSVDEYIANQFDKTTIHDNIIKLIIHEIEKGVGDWVMPWHVNF
ncbi:MAG: hypothetical protein OMM_11205, partial [Candidatus Magnetoglobus multicellularis str. Araruama]